MRAIGGHLELVPVVIVDPDENSLSASLLGPQQQMETNMFYIRVNRPAIVTVAV